MMPRYRKLILIKYYIRNIGEEASGHLRYVCTGKYMSKIYKSSCHSSELVNDLEEIYVCFMKVLIMSNNISYILYVIAHIYNEKHIQLF